MAFWGAVGGALGGVLVDKVFNNTPGKESGQSLGQGARDYYDAAFPGTNPWERLGAGNPSGATAVADQKAKTDRNAQRTQAGIASTQQATQIKVAKIHADATKAAAGVSAAPSHRQATVAEAKADPEIAQIVSDTLLKDANAKLTAEQTEKIAAEIEQLLAKIPGDVAFSKIQEEISKVAHIGVWITMLSGFGVGAAGARASFKGLGPKLLQWYQKGRLMARPGPGKTLHVPRTRDGIHNRFNQPGRAERIKQAQERVRARKEK